jgi:hypothetical protein
MDYQVRPGSNGTQIYTWNSGFEPGNEPGNEPAFSNLDGSMVQPYWNFAQGCSVIAAVDVTGEIMSVDVIGNDCDAR